MRTKIDELRGQLDETRNDLREARRTLSARAMKSLERLKGTSSHDVQKRYLTSQTFVIEGIGNGLTSPQITFLSSGIVRTKSIAGDIRWHIHEGTIYLVDAEQNTERVGELNFTQASNCFVGKIGTMGIIRLKGVFHAHDFERE